MLYSKLLTLRGTKMVPPGFSSLARLFKFFIRWAVYQRLNHFSLSVQEAGWWANAFKDWPAIFWGDPYTRPVQLSPGIKMELGITDVVQRNLLVTGRWDSEIGRVLQLYLKPGSTFVDIGANIGYFSLMASRLVGEKGMVFSFEPSRRALEILLKHIRINRCSNIVVISTGIGEQNSLGHLRLATPNNIGASSFREKLSAVGEELTAVVSLDKLFDGMEITPDLIKIDVEGYELHALRGMTQLLRRCSPTVICEVTEDFLSDLGASATQICDLVEGLGYRAYIVQEKQGKVVGRRVSSGLLNVPKNQVNILISKKEPLFECEECFLDS
jgi:FkbM family methyltransferase